MTPADRQLVTAALAELRARGRRAPLPAPSRDPDATARWAHDHRATLARAAIVHGCSLAAVEAAWARLYPAEPRRAVP
jgi:hypothetical protein